MHYLFVWRLEKKLSVTGIPCLKKFNRLWRTRDRISISEIPEAMFYYSNASFKFQRKEPKFNFFFFLGSFRLQKEKEPPVGC